MVMTFHLFAGMAPLGEYAVFGFYIISGYLMTLIMNETYGHTWAGRYSFAVNRVLRLYPQYWAAATFSIVLIFALGPDAASGYHESLYIPTSPDAVVYNLLMIFPSWNPGDVNPRLVPPTWALTVEICFYFLICFGISQTFRRVKIWVLLSVCYVIASYLAGLSWQDRYFPVAAASLPFSIGSAVYFLSKRTDIKDLYFKWGLSSCSLFVLLVGNCLVWMVLSEFIKGNVTEVGFYINIVLCFLLVYSIATGNNIYEFDRRIDKFIGDLSYPIYLLHWQTGLLTSFIIFGRPFYGFSIRGLVVLAGSIIVVTVIALVFVQLIDIPIQRTRSKIKARHAFQPILIPGATTV
jgi:peptidoglycan/LPS O-acetylase OafA/YrhL